MLTTKTHVIEIDETDYPAENDTAYAAFCSCGWKSEWHHADWWTDEETSFEEAQHLAEFSAIADADIHEIEMGGE